MASKINLPRDAHLNIKIAHLNVRSLQFRENFILIKDTIQLIGFDIFTISETWLDSSVPTPLFTHQDIQYLDKVVVLTKRVVDFAFIREIL